MATMFQILIRSNLRLQAFKRAAANSPVSLNELMKVGERRLNMLRLFNAREGFNRMDDRLPAKFFEPLGGTGLTAGVALAPQEFEESSDLYYHIPGWTGESVPTRASLAISGIEWVAV
jgi:aldehyde:ferredoxin oxidoreductase